MTGRLQYPPVFLGFFCLHMIAVTAVMYVVAPPLQATVYTLFWGGVNGAGLYACHRFGEDHEAEFQQFATGSAGLALVLFFGGYLFSGIEMGLILLLLTLQAGRNLVLNTRRDLNFACLISLVIMLYGAGKAMAGYFIAFIVLYALAGMFTFMADHIDGRLALAQGGDRELLSRGMNLPVKGIGLTLLTLSLALAIYLLVPQPSSPRLQAFPSKSNWNYDNRNWQEEAQRQGNGTGGERQQNRGESPGNSRRPPMAAMTGNTAPSGEYSGFQERCDITEGNMQVVNRDIDVTVLYVQADNPFYARGKVFDTFDGRLWTDSGAGAEKRYSREGQFSFGARPGPSDTLQVYTVQHDIPPFIFAANRPLLAAFPGNAIEVDAALTLRAPDRLRKGTVYSVASRTGSVEQHPCSATQEPGEEGRTADGRYLDLYPGVSPRLRQLASDITQNARDDFGKARAIESYLQEQYAYTRDTMHVQWQGNPVEQFLFELKAGHCELFASSMVVLLRTLQIPSRLVTGFYVNRYNPVTGYYEVRRLDGHAWVEAYLEPHGWVTFEPTSSFELPRCKPRLFVATGLLRYLDDRAETLIRKHHESWWAQSVQKLLLAVHKLWLKLKIKLLMLKLKAILKWHWFLREGWQWLLLVIAIGGASWGLWRRYEPAWRLAKLQRARGGDSRHFLTLCYREMERLGAVRGVPRPPQATPLEYEQLLARRFPHLAPQIATITRLFQQAAYGPLPVTAEEAQETLRAFEEVQRHR